MSPNPTWLTRTVIVATTILAEAGALVTCGVIFALWGVNLDARWLPIFDHGGSLFICVAAPSAAFAAVRAIRRDARLISWAYLIPVASANAILAIAVQVAPADFGGVWPRWALLVGSIVIPGAGALAGTFIRPRSITVGPIPEDGRGVRIT